MTNPEQPRDSMFLQFHEGVEDIQHETAVKVTDAINELTVELPGGGYLSNLAWNIRNRYLASPNSTFEAVEVQMLVEGFLAEVEQLKPLPTTDSDPSEAGQ